MTAFMKVYNNFLQKITDDMYMELTPQDTLRDLQNLLVSAIPNFEFPRKSLSYTIATENGEDSSYFSADLTDEEINILALLMKQNWLSRQVASIENIRMKYSGPDFKMTSQANHLSKLLSLLTEVQREAFHMQRLYKRRVVDAEGNYKSNWSIFRRSHA